MSEDKLAKDISEKIKKDIDEMCLNYRLLGEIHNKDVEIREEQKQEIERLNKRIERLQERFDILKQEHIEKIDRVNDLRERIDKALKLLEDWNYLDKLDCYREPREVIDILRGDKE